MPVVSESLPLRRVAARTRLDFWFDAAILHWDWVVRTTGRLLRPRGPDKLIWLVNLALLFAMTLCVASGILISRVALPELRISLPLDDPFWDRAHTLTAEVTLGLVPVHVALRWRWTAGGGLSGIPPIQLGDLLEPVNLAVLWNTAWIEAAVIAAVVIVDAGCRKLRRTRRAR